MNQVDDNIKLTIVNLKSSYLLHLVTDKANQKVED